ncbi:MAG: hypothetical protein ACTSVX_11560 [Promethearchaeota archaeon]
MRVDPSARIKSNCLIKNFSVYFGSYCEIINTFWFGELYWFDKFWS